MSQLESRNYSFPFFHPKLIANLVIDSVRSTSRTNPKFSEFSPSLTIITLEATIIWYLDLLLWPLQFPSRLHSPFRKQCSYIIFASHRSCLKILQRLPIALNIWIIFIGLYQLALSHLSNLISCHPSLLVTIFQDTVAFFWFLKTYQTLCCFMSLKHVIPLNDWFSPILKISG